MQRLIFERDPDVTPTDKLSIYGRSRAGADQLRAYAARRNPQAPDVAGLYLEKAARCGIRGDVAFCQAMLDTRVWSVEPPGPPWSPFAYAIWGGLAYTGQAQDELERRTQRHLDLLVSIADNLQTDEPCWEDLGGIWAVANRTYGRDIVSLWRNMVSWAQGKSESARKDQAQSFKPGGESGQASGAEAGGIRISVANAHAAHGDADRRSNQAVMRGQNAKENLAWLDKHAWLPTPSPYPGRKVSWAELARVVSSLEQRRPGQGAVQAMESVPDKSL